jgi:hypothetical protein
MKIELEMLHELEMAQRIIHNAAMLMTREQCTEGGKANKLDTGADLRAMVRQDVISRAQLAFRAEDEQQREGA